MRALTSTELSRMQHTQVDAMMDTCVRMVYSETKQPSGFMKPTWTNGPLLECGYEPRGGDESRETDKTLVTWDAKLRLPLRTTIDLRDRVRITSRYLIPTDVDTVFEIVGPVQEGPSCIVLLLKKVEPSQ